MIIKFEISWCFNYVCCYVNQESRLGYTLLTERVPLTTSQSYNGNCSLLIGSRRNRTFEHLEICCNLVFILTWSLKAGTVIIVLLNTGLLTVWFWQFLKSVHEFFCLEMVKENNEYVQAVVNLSYLNLGIRAIVYTRDKCTWSMQTHFVSSEPITALSELTFAWANTQHVFGNWRSCLFTWLINLRVEVPVKICIIFKFKVWILGCDKRCFKRPL